MATGRVPTTANSPLTAKGDLFTYDTSQARLAVGNNGETLVADSSASTGLRWQGSEAAGKNYLINGGIDIWQRGTSFTIGTSPWTYTCDRWAGVVSSGTATYARESTVIPSGTRYSMKITAGGTQIPYFAQEIETANVIPFAGKTITFSAQVAASTSIPMTMTVEYSTNVDEPLANSQTNIAASSGGTATPTSTTFVTISGTYAIPSTAKSIRVYLAPTSNMTSGQVIYIGKLQFEIGSVATSFSRAGGTIAGELAACQRYYIRYTTTNSGVSASGGNLAIPYWFPAQMRTNATVTHNFTNANYTTNWTLDVAYVTGNVGKTGTVTFNVNNNSPHNATLYLTGATWASTPNVFYPMGSGYLEASAEL